ncbi:hypothetical protein KI659_06835 [Litoribacter alkaliphilus]|uniref:Uncharacterized protein n=1 Tax=Litoribacter ruber TaxID=702568 RepID=A0AAP2G4R5_9BACT|nr:hypothetical protein [Litoribacter alkaliphilus]MBS9523733.1 hypothetical protein [Litoribacter alkaliphilus]
MFQKILFSAGLMLVVLPSWGQETLDFDGVELKVFGIVSPEKVDRMPILQPSPEFNSKMEIAALPPDLQAKMPIYNDTQVDVLADYKPSSPPLRVDGSKYELDLPKFEAPATFYPIGK